MKSLVSRDYKSQDMPCLGFSLHHVQLWGLKHFFSLEALGCGQGEHPLAMAMSCFCSHIPLSWPCLLAMIASYCHGHVPKQWLCLSELGQAWRSVKPCSCLGLSWAKQCCLATDLVQSHSSAAMALQHYDHIPGVLPSHCPN